MTNGLDMDAIATYEEDLDIDTLNDSELYEKLKENSIIAGPIVDSTREVYKKKLKKVLYGEDDESFASDGEAELVNDNMDEDEILAEDEEKETVDNGDLTDPIMENEDEDPIMENEEEEEVVDGVGESQCESKSDTEDDQPSGVSRPVDAPSGLRKRLHRNDAESNQVTAGNGTAPQPDAKYKTSALMFIAGFLVIVMVGVAIAIYFLNADMPDTVDSVQEAIQEAANKAAVDVEEEAIQEAANKAAMDVEEEFIEATNKAAMDVEEVFIKAANKAASGVEGEEVINEAANKAASGVEGEEISTF